MIYHLWYTLCMYPLSPQIRSMVAGFNTDTGTKAGILKIFERSGKLYKPEEIKGMSELEREWFMAGFNELMTATGGTAHPAHDGHAPVHYGCAIYFLSVIYYMTLAGWVVYLATTSANQHKEILWPSVWVWIASASVFNIFLTIYGIYLEIKAYHGHLTNLHRWMAGLAIIALIIAILGNFIWPYSAGADSNSVLPTQFFTN